jgi:fibronectin-binding autotransporter adhesin
VQVQRHRKSNRRLSGLLAGLLAITVTTGPAIKPALAATCTLTSPTTWTLGSSGVWGTAGNWTPATVPNSGTTNVCIVDGTSTVSLNGSFTVGDLQLASGNTVAIGGNTLNVAGSSIINGGAITIGGGNLTLQNNVMLSGGGTITTTSDTFINQASGGLTLTNVDNTIQGTGQYGQNGLAIVNESGGRINALGGTLSLNGGGTITNAGLIGAVSTGSLTIDNTVNNAGGNITANAGTVTVNSTIDGGTLNAMNSGTLTSGTATLNGVTISSGTTYNVGGQTFLQGAITNKGIITVPDTTLTISGGDVTLTGGGTVAISSDAFINQASGGLTLHNVNNTIQGTGQLGQNGMALDNQSGGIVNANVTSGTLFLNGGGTVTNAGLLEATNGGTLQLNNNVINTGNITANGGTVVVNSAITGGTLNQIGTGVLTSGTATLNGVTLSAGSTYNVGWQTFLQGTITNNGIITVPDTTLTIQGGTGVTLTGGGTVKMSNDAFFNQASGGLTLDNVNNTIEGTGQLGQNGMALLNESGGIVNANVNGGTLSLNGGGLVTNAGLLEATNNGILTIDNAVNNGGGNITANGGTVNLASQINGGTLNTINGGVMNAGSGAVLNTLTISTGSMVNDTNQVFLEGAITNKGNIAIPNNNLTIAGGDVTLTGGGTVTMSSDAFFNQASGGLTLHNVNNTIQGTGQLGQNGMALDNQANGVVNATGGTLSLNGGGLVTNAGLLEATGTGTLNINNTVNNTATGNITANAGIVNISSQINGGTLNGLNGGVMNAGSGAVLNNLTISTGTTVNDVNQTFLEGTITNKGTIAVPNNTLTIAGGTVTLTGGGTVTMSSDAFFNQASGGLVLNNVDNSIQGTGQLGQNGMTINNGGAILANVNGGTLNVNGGGILTNTGTLKATDGGRLLVSTPFSTADFSGGVLQGGGTYIINGTVHPSTLQINSLGTGGGEITTVGAGTTLVLDGACSLGGACTNVNFLDASGDNALAITTNHGNIYLEGGFNSGVFGEADNSGNLLIDSTSSMTTTGNYIQTAGITQVDGTLTAPLVNIDGGVLEGDGTLTASAVTIASGAAIQAGDTLNTPVDPPGTLNISGPLDLNDGSTVNETISGSALADISLLNVTGDVNTGAREGVDVMLLNGFDPTTTSRFIFLDYTGALSTQSFFVIDPKIDPNGTFGIGYDLHDAYLTFTPNTSAVPEPATFLPLAGLLASLAYGIRRRKQSKQAA